MREPDQLPSTLNEYYQRARTGMSEENRAYFLSGAGNEETLIGNEQAFGHAKITPRPLRGMGGGSTETSLLGQTFSSPLLIAPFAYHRLLHPSGEVATAHGAEAQNTKMVLSAQSSAEIKQVRAAGNVCDWFQLYWMGSREVTLELAEMALAAGFSTLVLTIDAPVQGVRDREIEAGFRLPPEVSAVNLSGFAPPQFPALTEDQSVVFDGIAPTLPDWDDVAWLIQSVQVPVLLKGILHPDDAAKSLSIGAAGVIVSNHGGRVLDKAPATLDVLPAIVAKVGPKYPVLMDGGIRRGVDIFVALALGAKAVLVGRPIVCGLAVAGELGVSHVLRLLRDELEVAMLLSGCATLDDTTRDMVHLKL
ncbi:alpha-hydroxy acid oxidase [Sulfitobacter noctilucicola]|uniref:4-hydroxymandelate oxidase n=1 Tax=Sulfitobacter noctilucicola TaxID=1342301 RepID=A0A7W6M9W0_9RHOB|nr:alpha-hydroxy acid oxidase [Sulfitobacter noctilucicola]MBB4175144.1 4-hydroxymandelate oxidase [Sulfitobacter noctilucicola]